MRRFGVEASRTERSEDTSAASPASDSREAPRGECEPGRPAETSEETQDTDELPAAPSGPPSVRAAHVLPIAVDPATGTLYALLGKERRVHGWLDSDAWSDFGGRMHPREDADAEAAAAREFWEETCALVSWGGSAPAVRVRYYDARAAIVRAANIFDECVSFARALRDREFALRLTSHNGMHTTFVKVIPFDAALPQSFDVVWRELHARFYAQVVRPAQRARAGLPLVRAPPERIAEIARASHASVFIPTPTSLWNSDALQRFASVEASSGLSALETSTPNRRTSISPEASPVSTSGTTDDVSSSYTALNAFQLSDEQMSEMLVTDTDEGAGSVTVRASFDDSPLSGSLLTRSHPARTRQSVLAEMESSVVGEGRRRTARRSAEEDASVHENGRNASCQVEAAFLEIKSIMWVPFDVLQHAVARSDGVVRHDADHLERLRSSFQDRMRTLLPILEAVWARDATP